MDIKKIVSVGFVTTMFLMAGVANATEHRAVATSSSRPASSLPVSAEVFARPVLWLLGMMGVPVEASAPLPNSFALDRDQGWQQVDVAIHDEGVGVFLEVSGRVEFDRAEITFEDGSTRSVSLAGEVRGAGLYVLLEPNASVRVGSVRLLARARSQSPRVGVRLGRTGPAPDQSSVL